MLKFEEYLNLNSENVREISSEIIDLESMENTVNENGPDSVPFRVNFNSLALNNSGREIE